MKHRLYPAAMNTGLIMHACHSRKTDGPTMWKLASIKKAIFCTGSAHTSSSILHKGRLHTMTCISNQLYSMRLQHGAAFSSSAPNDTVGKNGRSRVGIFDVLEKTASLKPKKYLQFTTGCTGKAKGKDAIIKGLSQTSSSLTSIQVGEDAFFARHDSMGIADGVGGWSEVKGANAALYSLKMMHYAHTEFEKYDDIANSEFSADEYNDISPKAVLSRSFEHVNRDAANEMLVGSTTAMLVVLRDDELRIANVGDCGVMVIRGYEPIFRNEEQQHSFNFPFQLGTMSKDSPEDAQSYTVKVREGDIVILATDGLFDNVFDEEIVEIINLNTNTTHPEQSNPQAITDALLLRAKEVSEDSRSPASPFQHRAVEQGFYYQGGKVDDVTVLAGVVRLTEDSPDRR